MKYLKEIAPDYPRIPHVSSLSNMTHDDLLLEEGLSFPITLFVQEKIDGANLRVSWYDGPVLGNREHILKKGYDARTPAKRQFVPAWNWLHAHENDIKSIIKEVGQVTIYGEWMLAEHSIGYNKLTDLFIAYDIWSVENKRFFHPNIVADLLSKRDIKYIKPEEVTINSFEELVELSERQSVYTDGFSEGIVCKVSDGRYIKSMFKMVNKHFIRCQNFNERDLIKNKLVKSK